MNIPIQQYWSLLATYLRPMRPQVAVLSVLLLGSIGLELLNPQIVRGFIDTATSGGAIEDLMRAALLFIGIALIQQIAAVAATYVGENIGWTATNALRTDLAAHCIRLDLAFHKARTPGELIERIDGDVTALSRFFSQFVIYLLSNALLMLGVLVLLFREDWRIGLTLSIFSIITVFLLQRIQSIAVPRWAAVRQGAAELFGFLGEHLAGTEDVRANGAVQYVMQRFYAQLRRLLPLQLRAGLAGYGMWMTTLAMFGLGNLVAFALGAWLYSSGSITLGTVYLIFHYTELLRRPIEQIRHQLEDLQRAGASIVRVRELITTSSQLADHGRTPLPNGALAVEFGNVTFAYMDTEPLALNRPATPSEQEPLQGTGQNQAVVETEQEIGTPHVLRDVSFVLGPGRVLGLLGRTGSGKTTLARLLLRLYDTSNGAVRLGGVDVRDTPLAELRSRVTMVTQDVQLFQASLRDNLTFFDPSIDDQRIIAVLDEIGLGAWLRTLPGGLDTQLESGGGLSAGESQLLALARVFLRDPGLIILDEASSRLDPATERLLERAIDKLLCGRTAIIIAHRLGTIQRADQVLILEDGAIAEYGERSQLVADSSSRLSATLRTGMEAVLA